MLTLRSFVPFLGALPCALLLSAAAHAEALTLSATGPRLAIDSPCAREVDVTVDPNLHGQARLEAEAANQGELAQLVFDSGEAARLHISGPECWSHDYNGGFSPTLVVRLSVPQGFAVAVTESGAGTYHIGPTGGALTLDISGAAKVTAESATSLDADLSGEADISVAHAAGNAHLELSGAGRIAIGNASIIHMNIDMSGNGAVTLNGGSVKKADIDVSGNGTVNLSATIGDARVDVSGNGDISLAHVTGTLSKEIDGQGNVRVGG